MPHDVALAPHCPLGPIALAACMQVDTAAPNFFIQEMSLEMHYNEGADLLTYVTDPSIFEIKDGYVEIPKGTGLGVSINEQMVRDFATHYEGEKAWRNAVWTGPDGSLREW